MILLRSCPRWFAFKKNITSFHVHHTVWFGATPTPLRILSIMSNLSLVCILSVCNLRQLLGTCVPHKEYCPDPIFPWAVLQPPNQHPLLAPLHVLDESYIRNSTATAFKCPELHDEYSQELLLALEAMGGRCEVDCFCEICQYFNI